MCIVMCMGCPPVLVSPGAAIISLVTNGNEWAQYYRNLYLQPYHTGKVQLLLLYFLLVASLHHIKVPREAGQSLVLVDNTLSWQQHNALAVLGAAKVAGGLEHGERTVEVGACVLGCRAATA